MLELPEQCRKTPLEEHIPDLVSHLLTGKVKFRKSDTKTEFKKDSLKQF